MITDERINEIKSKLRELIKESDTEIVHIEADEILCQLLIELGYDDIVALWMEVDKWYA